MEMEYRRLGRSGLKVSVLSLGSWVTFGPQLDSGLAADCMAAAHEAGVNFFDNAESYAGGESERLMGEAIRKNGWPRHEYVVSSKFYWGIHDTPTARLTLNRKYLLEAIPASLERMGLDHLDLIFCHHLHKPVMEQPQYNMLSRRRVEKEYARLYEDIGIGITTWSPLASGLLTGKYLDGIPEGSRAALGGYDFITDRASDAEVSAKIRSLVDLASELGCTPAQLAIAWCARNPHVSTVITGASRVEQVHENMRALDVVPLLTDEVMARIDELL